MERIINSERGILTLTIPITVNVDVKSWSTEYDVECPVDVPLVSAVQRDVTEYFQFETFEQLGCAKKGCIVDSEGEKFYS
jgi:hypothetical protein